MRHHRRLLGRLLFSFLCPLPTAPFSQPLQPQPQQRWRPPILLAAADSDSSSSARRSGRFYRVFPISLGDVDGEPCVVLSSARSVAELQGNLDGHSVLCLPASEPASAMPMLENAVKGFPMGKSDFLRLAPGLVNRDGGLYDELPWEEWTIGDPFFAKRDCFERFYGRDYPGQSLTAQNLAGGARDRSSLLDGALAAINGGNGGGGGGGNGGGRPAPYRGAYGFNPLEESRDDRKFAGYASPYALMAEVIRDQFRAKVAAGFLGDAWLLDDSIRIGGAIELKRLERPPGNGGSNDDDDHDDDDDDDGMVTIGGFLVPNPVSNAALRRERGLDAVAAPVGGVGVVGDCLPDEAIGVALSCSSQQPIPIFIEKDVWAAAAAPASSFASLKARVAGSARAWGGVL